LFPLSTGELSQRAMRCASVYLRAWTRYGLSSRRTNQDLEPGLPKMAIRCQRIGQPQLAHHHETAAIGERIRVVGMLSEKSLGLVEAQWSDPFDTNSGAALQQIENSQGNVRAAAGIRE